MSRKTLRIYSKNEFLKADRLDRIRMHLVEPDRFHLLEAEEFYLNKLQQAYHQVFNELRQTEAIRWIQNNIFDCETWYKANRLYSDMCELFGHFIQKNLEMKRQLAVEKLYYYAQRMEEDENWEAAANITEKAARLEGLDKIVPGFNPDDFEFPEIEVNSDPETLRLAHAAEDADWEEEDEDEG